VSRFSACALACRAQSVFMRRWVHQQAAPGSAQDQTLQMVRLTLARLRSKRRQQRSQELRQERQAAAGRLGGPSSTVSSSSELSAHERKLQLAESLSQGEPSAAQLTANTPCSTDKHAPLPHRAPFLFLFAQLTTINRSPRPIRPRGLGTALHELAPEQLRRRRPPPSTPQAYSAGGGGGGVVGGRRIPGGSFSPPSPNAFSTAVESAPPVASALGGAAGSVGPLPPSSPHQHQHQPVDDHAGGRISPQQQRGVTMLQMVCVSAGQITGVWLRDCSPTWRARRRFLVGEAGLIGMRARVWTCDRRAKRRCWRTGRPRPPPPPPPPPPPRSPRHHPRPPQRRSRRRCGSALGSLWLV
jgi:hypothetical protein